MNLGADHVGRRARPIEHRVLLALLAGVLTLPAAAAWWRVLSSADGVADTTTQPIAVQLDVNTAGEGELRALPNIGPARSGAIVASREAAGPFATLDDLDRVHGIGPRTIRSLRPFAYAGETPR